MQRGIVVSVALVGLAIALGAGLHVLRSAPQPATPALLATYDDGKLHFVYPAGWHPQKYVVSSSFDDLIIFLSPQVLHDPCTRIAGKSAVGPTFEINCGWPVHALPPGGVLIGWWVASFPGWQLTQAAGDPTVISGLPSKLAVARPGTCGAIGADETLTATIPFAPENYYELLACFRSPNASNDESQVRTLLRSTKLTLGNTATANLPGSLLSGVDFVTPEIGWVVSSPDDPTASRTLLRTTDGGQHWKAQKSWLGSAHVGRDHLLPTQLVFLDDRNGFVLDQDGDQGMLYRTRDGGANWLTLALPGLPGPGSSLSFVDPKDGFLLTDVGAAMGQSSASVFGTYDGGDHWKMVAHVDYNAVSRGLSSAGDKDSLVFRNSFIGFLTAFNTVGPPLLSATFDGGVTWTDETLSEPAKIDFSWNGAPFPPTFFGSQTGVFPIVTTLIPLPTGQPTTVPPEGYPSVLYAYTTGDGGKEWLNLRRLPAIGTDKTPLYWHFLDANHWWVGTGNRIWVSQDGGGTWKTYSLDLASGYVPVSLDFITPQVGYAVAESGVQSAGTFPTAALLLKTGDGGAHWEVVSLPH